MPRSPSRSRIELLALAALAALITAACSGGPSCGPGDIAGDGLSLAGTGVDVRYSDLHASANNDCPDPGAPAGVVSLTISGKQTGETFPIVLCIPRPDRLDGRDVHLDQDVKIVDLGANLGGGCTLARASAAPSGTVGADGVCNNGKDAAGFALRFDGTVPMTKTCGASTTPIDLALTGSVAVAGK
jgi:hypothetical protein